MLNRGKNNVGSTATPAHVSYGNQSPADDAVPLAWIQGDVRYYQEAGSLLSSKISVKWVCITGGTPGVWQLVREPFLLPVLHDVNVYKGGWNFGGGTEIFMAPATADWAAADEGNPNPLIVPIPPTTDLESTGPGPTYLSLSVWLSKNEWDTPTANGLLFRVRLNDGTVLGSGTVNANVAFVGHFNPVSQLLAAGIMTTAGGLRASLEADAAAGTASFDCCAVMTLYRDFSANFPS